MLRRFETLLDPTAGTPAPPPNAGLVSFYWFYIRQVRGLTVALFVFGGLIAVLDTMIPAFIGRVVSLVSSHTPDTLFRDDGGVLLGMAAVVLIAASAGGHVAQRSGEPDRQSRLLEHDPLAEPLARRAAKLDVLPERFRRAHRQPGAADRPGAARKPGDGVRRRLVHPGLRLQRSGAAGAAGLAADAADAAVVCCYAVMLRWFVPRLRDRSRHVSEMRSNLTGRVVDSYTNILTVKLFARAADEDAVRAR